MSGLGTVHGFVGAVFFTANAMLRIWSEEATEVYEVEAGNLEHHYAHALKIVPALAEPEYRGLL